MGNEDLPFSGKVRSMGRSIFVRDGSSGQSTALLPSVSPTIDWVRIPQGFPVGIQVDSSTPIELRIGQTVSVAISHGPQAAAVHNRLTSIRFGRLPTHFRMLRNILAHAADASITSDDVVRMFLQWVHVYSEFHFVVIAAIYNDKGVTRARIWEKVGKEEVREDSAEADLFKLLIRDLSTGGIIRQNREKDYHGNFLRKPAQRRRTGASSSTTMESAFEDTKGYELTELGQQFVHYAMTDLPLRIEFPQNGSA
jgi:hypothetical protein